MHTYLHICKHTHKNSWCIHLRIDWKQCALVYTYICINKYTYTYTRMYIHIYIHTYVHTAYIHTYKHIYRQTCIHTYAVYTYTGICMYVQHAIETVNWNHLCILGWWDNIVCVWERVRESVCVFVHFCYAKSVVFVRATRIQRRSKCSLYNVKPR